MIAFDLACSAGHVFEAWFRSSADYEDQRARALIACPICGDAAVAKAVMAPNVGAKGNRAPALPAPPAAGGPMMAGDGNAPSPEAMRAVLAAVAAAQAEALPRSTWVGKRFAEEARAIHRGERDGDAPIHGQATPAEARELHEEGVAVMPLLVPVVPPEAKH